METVIVQPTRKFQLLRNRNFLLLYLGGLVSWLGNNVYYIGLSWYVLDQLHSGISLATVMLVGSIPEIVLGPISGVMVDRLDRKKIIVAMDFIRGFLILMMSQTLGKDYFYPVLLVGTFLMAVCESFFSPAISSSIPNIVNEKYLIQANSLFNLSDSFNKILGFGVGGLLVALLGVKGVFYLNGLSFIASAISECFINVPLQKIGEKDNELPVKKTLFKDLREGFRFLYTEKSLMAICILAILLNFFFVGSLGVVLPYIVKEVMNFGEVQFGLMEIFFPVGAIAGAGLLGLLPQVKRLYRVIFRGVVTLGFLLVLIGLVIFLLSINKLALNDSYWIIGINLALIGLINVLINVPVTTLFQKLVPDHYRGRFYGFFGTLSQGLIPLAYFVSGLVLGFAPPYVLMFFGGAALILVALGSIPVMKKKNL